MESESGKEEVELFSEWLGVMLVNVFIEGDRLFQRVGQFVGKNSLKFSEYICVDEVVKDSQMSEWSHEV